MNIKNKGGKKMSFLLNTANPIIVLLYTIIAVCLIILGKKFEVSILPGALVIFSIILLISHSLQLEGATESVMISQSYICLSFDFILLLLSFLAYLWIDNIVSKKKNKKSYDDGLSWFWDKI